MTWSEGWRVEVRKSVGGAMAEQIFSMQLNFSVKKEKSAVKIEDEEKQMDGWMD